MPIGASLENPIAKSPDAPSTCHSADPAAVHRRLRERRDPALQPYVYRSNDFLERAVRRAVDARYGCVDRRTARSPLGEGNRLRGQSLALRMADLSCGLARKI